MVGRKLVGRSLIKFVKKKFWKLKKVFFIFFFKRCRRVESDEEEDDFDEEDDEEEEEEEEEFDFEIVCCGFRVCKGDKLFGKVV